MCLRSFMVLVDFTPVPRSGFGDAKAGVEECFSPEGGMPAAEHYCGLLPKALHGGFVRALQNIIATSLNTFRRPQKLAPFVCMEYWLICQIQEAGPCMPLPGKGLVA